ncbi:hypothetical protein [Wenyingzhuangia sp. IMCC45574]
MLIKTEVILSIDKKFKNSLADIRNLTSIKVAEHDDLLWIRVLIENEETLNKLYNVRFKEFYFIKDNYLFKRNKITPEMLLFNTDWTPINEYFTVSMPTVAFGGKIGQLEVHPKLRAHYLKEKTFGILVNTTDLEEYLIQAPSFRFKVLQYAKNDKHQIFVFGTPLLPIKGKSYWKYKEFLLPNGYILDSKSQLDILARKIDNSNYVLINEDNTYQIIPKEAIKPLTRKAIVD